MTISATLSTNCHVVFLSCRHETRSLLWLSPSHRQTHRCTRPPIPHPDLSPGRVCVTYRSEVLKRVYVCWVIFIQSMVEFGNSIRRWRRTNWFRKETALDPSRKTLNKQWLSTKYAVQPLPRKVEVPQISFTI